MGVRDHSGRNLWAGAGSEPTPGHRHDIRGGNRPSELELRDPGGLEGNLAATGEYGKESAVWCSPFNCSRLTNWILQINRLVTFQNACLWSADVNTHKIDKWMLRLLLEHALPLDDKPPDPDPEDSRDDRYPRAGEAETDRIWPTKPWPTAGLELTSIRPLPLYVIGSSNRRYSHGCVKAARVR